MALFTKRIDHLTDIELEEALKLLEMDVRWNRNQAYALSSSQSTRLMKRVKRQEEQLRRLWAERERRIVQGGYRPFS